MRPAMGTALLGLGVGLALADSSIVTLALPEILGELDVGITTVAWVLTSFNLVLALTAVPAAYVARRAPRGVTKPPEPPKGAPPKQRESKRKRVLRHETQRHP